MLSDSLSDSQLTDAEMSYLDIPQLKTLNIDGANITDVGLKALRRHPNLRRLDLARIPIDDDAVPTLAGIPNLEVVDLTGTRVSTRGVFTLRSALPGCAVWHDLGYTNVTVDKSSARGFPALESLQVLVEDSPANSGENPSTCCASF